MFNKISLAFFLAWTLVFIGIPGITGKWLLPIEKFSNVPAHWWLLVCTIISMAVDYWWYIEARKCDYINKTADTLIFWIVALPVIFYVGFAGATIGQTVYGISFAFIIFWMMVMATLNQR